MTDTAVLVTALTHPGFGPGEPVSRKEWWPLLTGAADAALAADPERLRSIEAELAVLADKGVRALTLLDEGYPVRWRERLRSKTPSVLFFVGDPGILKAPSVGIVGSRAADEATLDFTAELAREATGRGFAVVSGGAKGVDLAAVVAATRAGGQAIVLAADSLRELQRRLAKAEVDLDQVLIATAYHPEAGFSVGQAMGRNKLIYTLSEVTVVAACDVGSGGTWAGAVEAIKAGWCPVGAWTGEGSVSANEKLVEEGALPVASAEDAFGLSASLTQESLF